jgi:hypothetical protein
MPKTEKRRRRGRPSNAERAGLLPPVPAIVADEPSNTADALAALDAAEKNTTAATENPTAAVMPAAAEIAASAPTTEKPRPQLPADRSTLTGRHFKSMQRVELATALQIAEKENRELRAQLADVAPAAAGEKLAAMERAVSIGISALFDLTALVTNLDGVRLDREEERELGELGAPALEPYMRDYAKHAPLVAFGGKLAIVITSKVMTAKAELAEKKASGRREVDG